jgi:uncharacterized protein (TIGR02996 family)
MPRYEFSEGSSNKFWEIKLEGATFTTTYGRIGAEGQTTLKTFKNDAEAKKAYDKLVAEKVKKGYELVGGEDGDDEDEAGEDGDFAYGAGPNASIESKTNPALEKAILANPDDVEARLVYADWLQSEGDPRGELIVMQHQKHDERAQEFIEKNKRSLLGPLRKFETTFDGSNDPCFAWSLGFIKSARFARDSFEDGEGVDLGEAIGMLVSHPSGRFLEALTFGINSDDGQAEYQDLVEALAKNPPPVLKSLFIADFEYPDRIEMSWTTLGDLSKLWPKLPRLETLTVQGGSFSLGNVVLPLLKSAEFRTGGLSLASLKSIASAKWPNLERLEIWFGDDNYGAEGGVDDIEPILNGDGLGKLKSLGLKNAMFTDEICRVLPNARILAQLERLDLSMGSMSDAGAMAIVEAKGKFAHLKSIDVSENYISEDGLAALARIGAKVIANRQREADDEEDRYVSVGE